MASREFSSAHATARPPGFVRTSSAICRAGEESLSPCPPPQPLSATLPAAPSWLSVEPTKPSRTGIEPLLAAAQVRVVRNDDGVAAGTGSEARPFDRRPEPLRDAARGRLDVARHRRRHALVADDDVAVEVAADRARRVLVADEARERARGGPVVGLLGRGLDVPPHGDRRGGAVDARRSAERKMRRVRDAGRVEPGDGRPELLVEGLRRAEDLALIAVVDRRAWAVAHPDLAEPLGVVGDGGEVERAGYPGAPRLHLVVVGERDW